MSQSWNPDERLESGIQSIKSVAHRSSREELLSQMQRRSRARSQARLRLTLGASATGVTVIAFLGILLPGKAIASFDKVVRATKGQRLYYQRTKTRMRSATWTYESDMEEWQFGDRSTTRTRQRMVQTSMDPGLSLDDVPTSEQVLWVYADGRTVCFEPKFRYAMSYDEGHSTSFSTSRSLSDLTNYGKVLHTQSGVRIHGGTFDEYEILVGEGKYATRQLTYVDPSTQLIRFIDQPRHAQSVSDAPNAEAIEESIELRYPSTTELTQKEPRLQDGYPVMTPGKLKTTFMKGIVNPESSQIVGGTKVTLFGVVVRSPGDIRAITTGGAPQDPEDEIHELTVLDSPTQGYRSRPWPVGGLRLVPDPNHKGGMRKILGCYRIGGRSFVVETSRRQILGKIPAEMTIRIPVYKYDTSRPIELPAGFPDRRTYPSKFAGYATFHTKKIYEMPGGIENGVAGAPLPSAYQTGTPAVGIQIPSG